jgi:hypothetical protein
LWRVLNSLDICSDLPSFIRYLFFVSAGNLVAYYFLMALVLFAQHFAQERASCERSKIDRERGSLTGMNILPN